MLLFVLAKTTASDLKLLAVGRMVAIKRALSGSKTRNGCEEKTVVVLRGMNLPGAAVTRLAKVCVTKAEPRRDGAAVTTLEGRVFEAMLWTSSATIANKLCLGKEIDLVALSAILLATVIEGVALVTRKEVDLCIDILPKRFDVFALLDHHGLELGL